MRLLCISTAFSNTDIALNFDGVRAYHSADSNAKQSENALVNIDVLLKEKKIDISQIECMSVVVGPGSFTGIRIGLGLVKGMSVAKPSLKLIGICSLDLMAHIYVLQSKPQNDFWCVINALSGNIFACKYNAQGKRCLEPKMLTGEELASLSGIIVGLKDENLSICSDYIEFTPKYLLSLSEQYYNENKFTPENELLPIYLRKSQAEQNYADKKN